MKLVFFDFTIPYLLKDSQYPVGGFAVQLSSWLKGLPSIGSQVGVLTWKGAKNYVDQEHSFDLLDTYDPKKGIKIAKYFYYYIPTLIKVTKKYNPDVVIQACSGVNTGILAFVCSYLNIPFVYRVANDMDVDGRCNDRLKAYEQRGYYYGLRKSSAILCQNTYQYDCLKELYPNKPMYVLHNPFDTSKVLEITKNRQNRSYIAWVGVFSKQKNIPLLLDIARQVPNVTFKIAGMPAKDLDTDSLLAIKELEKLPNVEFAGYIKRENIHTFLDSAVALLSTSHYEGFSNTFLEALATGVPVIAPKRIDPDMIVSKNKLGLTTDDDNQLKDLITEMVSKKEHDYQSLSSRCKAFLLDNFTPEAKSKELVTFLNDTLFQGEKK
ncbi:MAG: glycosyltransferase [Paraglaciecola sp.]|uniref:glycosyltransferase family 4 protein n=1 Tax=Paraglaciecola sp. TaxID=1920173 RepID=UPI003267040D